MVRKTLLLLALIALLIPAGAQLRSPEDFLGYKVGTRFTPHWKILDYFNQVAANMPSMVKLQQYGKTNEDRPLVVTFISSPENIKNLEQIRLNNIRLADLAKDNMAPVEENAPAIVWLSYNVHGNEASSSEAAMLTLYALVDPSNNQTKEWLKNTVVVIDPCINPDGRDRYVNWYNSIAGKVPDPRLMAREHDEPWPGGRTNHYNFDLNRDWAWQVQVESQQRIKLYNQWLPQIHVDYHEQDIDAPYYFAPAAPSYHDVITPWQRNFQVTIGKNHAKYFDSNNWLYFTKEVFDLFYPSYGDTYPMFNGAIGMTYEQAGGPAGGLSALEDQGDTLTLTDRVLHHYTTGLSTIETASQNARKLIKEFRKYFNDAASNGVGEYKSYIIKKGSMDAQRLTALLSLLDRNGISYSAATPGSGRGYHYTTGKEESLAISAEDVLISSVQPKGALVKALMEPNSHLEDSVTYDITAWSLPYVYGLDAFALKENLRPSDAVPKPGNTAPAKTDFGYVIRWEGMQSVRVVTALLNKGVLLRYAQEPFDVNGQSFNRGSVIVLKNGNGKFGAGLWDIVLQACSNEQVKAEAISTGFVDKGYDLGSSRVHSLKAPRVVLATGQGVDPSAAGEVWHFFEQQINYPVTLVNAGDLSSVDWNAIDVLIMPDGNNYSFLNDKANVDKLKDWISKGGRLIAMRKAIAQLAKAEIGIRLKKNDTDDKADKDSLYAPLKKFSDRERQAASGDVPGAIIKVDLDNTHPLAFGYPPYFYTLKLEDRVYEFFKENGWNVGVIKKNNQVSGFIGAERRANFRDGLLFGVQEMGQGSVTYLAGEILYRGFWENGKLMFCNAVFLVGQ
jgi:hypothetical protein